jgi:hypothetical protein
MLLYADVHEALAYVRQAMMHFFSKGPTWLAFEELMHIFGTCVADLMLSNSESDDWPKNACTFLYSMEKWLTIVPNKPGPAAESLTVWRKGSAY